MSNFVVQFPLIVEKWQADILNKRMEIGRKIYNSLLGKTLKKYNEMIKTREYKSLVNSLERESDGRVKSTDKSKKNKEIYKQINALRVEYKISEYDFHSDVKPFQKYYKKHIDSFTAQKIGTNLWKSYEKFLFGNGKQIHFKKYDTFNSLEGKSNKSGIKFRNDKIEWNGLIIPVKIDYDNYYENEAMKSDIAYCRIVRKFIRGKYKFYVQIVFRGVPPVKINNETEKIKRTIGFGDVGIDIGTSTIAYCSKDELKILELANKVRDTSKQKRVLLRAMDRSKRATNTNNFNKDGTVKTGTKNWIFSNRYFKLKNKLKDIYRKESDIRKYQHECLANHIISLGDKIYVEKMNFSGLRRRSKNTEKNSQGKFKRKKRFGKSLGNRAPSMLLEIIDRKLKYYGKELTKINTYSVKASQFEHTTKTHKKVSLNQRWKIIGNNKVQRDLYSSFLIMNINPDLESINVEKCNNRFDIFLKLHSLEVNRLLGNKNLRSIGI